MVEETKITRENHQLVFATTTLSCNCVAYKTQAKMLGRALPLHHQVLCKPVYKFIGIIFFFLYI